MIGETTVYFLTAEALTHPGQKRPNNEDFVAFFEPKNERDLLQSGSLYIVADGVGGASRGEQASQFAAQKVLYEYYRRTDLLPAERLVQAMKEAGNTIYRFSQEGARFTRMATTMVAAAIVGKRLIVANVGDSRAYIIRNGHVRQITRDHNLVGEMVREGIMNEAEALRSKVKNRLTRSLGGEPDPTVDVFEVQLQPGDRILLCSDGLTRYALKDDIARLAGEGSPADVVQHLIDFANERGGADNISVVLVEVGPEVTPGEWVSRKQGAEIPLPEDVELFDEDEEDVTATQPIPPSRQNLIGAKRRHTIERWIWAAVGGMLVIACAVASWWIGGYRRPSQSLTPSAQLFVPPAATSAPTKPSSPVPTRGITPTLAATPTAALLQSPTSTLSVVPLSKTDTPAVNGSGCFAKLSPFGVYDTLHSFGYFDQVAEGSFWSGYYDAGRRPELIYLLNAQEENYHEYPLTKQSVNILGQQSAHWQWLLLPGVDESRCEEYKQEGRIVLWRFFSSPLPEWTRYPPSQLTPIPTAPATTTPSTPTT